VTVLVTGASGFVGRALCAALIAHGSTVRGAVRSGASTQDLARGCAPAVVGDVGPDTDWREALSGVTAVAHLAARVHVMRERSVDPLAAFRRVNVEGTLQLARSAAAAGVARLVFLSSVKVNGESSARPLTEVARPAPSDAYGVSKWEAEQALSGVSRETGLPIVVLRPPLVYGPGVKANFLRLMAAVERGVPLPLGSIDNRRSLVYLGNLVDAIRMCLTHPGVAGRTYFVADGEDLSTPALVRRLAAALAVRPRLWPIPPAALAGLGALTGRRAAIERLTGSLQVDIGALRRDTGWSPPFSVDQGLAATARWYRTVAAG
jgi:nucleoside-diphosphate-sugar epimerase